MRSRRGKSFFTVPINDLINTAKRNKNYEFSKMLENLPCEVSNVGVSPFDENILLLFNEAGNTIGSLNLVSKELIKYKRM